MISIQQAVNVILLLVLGGVIFGLLRWLINSSPMDQKFKDIANWILIVLAVLVLIGILLSLVGVVQGPLFRP